MQISALSRVESDPNAFARCWTELESTRPQSKYMRRVIELGYVDLASIVGNRDHDKVRELAESLYDGDVYVIKGAFPEDLCREMTVRVHAFGRTKASSFHKMIDGCPDFHRAIDSTTTRAYSVSSVRHGYYFFRWNSDPLRLFDAITERWRVFKAVGGLAPDAFERNLPKDGTVDRLIFYHYPKGGGCLGTHVDPINHHKVIMGGLLSTRGVDFESGGLYFVGPGDAVCVIEEHLAIGDFVLAYPTVRHGVTAVDADKPLDWDTSSGRWFLGLSSVDSDCVAERKTAQRIEG